MAGMGLVARLVESVGLAEEINAAVSLLAVHRPYYESYDVLNVAYNACCVAAGGWRTSSCAAATVGVPRRIGGGQPCRIRPRPGTSAGGSILASVLALQEAFNAARLKVWARQSPSFFAATATIDADASIVGTDGESKQGIDIGYTALGLLGVVGLPGEHRRAAVPGVARRQPAVARGGLPLYDRRRLVAGRVPDILLRGDTDFSLTSEFDRWDADGVRSCSATTPSQPRPGRRGLGTISTTSWPPSLTADRHPAPDPPGEHQRRDRSPARLQDDPAQDRRRGRVLLPAWHLQPGLPGLALRKNLSIERGDDVLLEEYRFFFYITNDWELTADEVMAEARRAATKRTLSPT